MLIKLSTGYTYLLLSIICSCILNVFIKLSNGFTKLIPSIIAMIFTIILTVLLGITFTKMPLNVSYGVYASTVILFTSIFGIIIYKEKFTKYTILGSLFIIMGILCLYFSKKNKN